MAAIAAAGDFGPRMKRLREQRGVSLREIAERTKISVRTLEALERDDVARLPGGIFSRSIVRAYADAIGSDPEGAVQDFTSRFPVESVFPGGPPAETRRVYLLITAGVLVLIPLIGIFVWLLTSRTAR
jgi:cytoskeletal protein RodZ